VVLFLFVVMMLDINAATLREGFLRYAPVGAIVAGIIALELAYVIWFRNDGLPVNEQLVPGFCYSSEQLGQSSTRSTCTRSSWPPCCSCWRSWQQSC
jgi:NADH-quinone oxidoreductase subunit J